jgi:hypothetical protein
MLLRTANPWKNPASGIYYFRQKIPADLVSLAGRKIEKASLKTKDPAEARRLFARQSAIFQERWHNLRLGPISFSHDDARTFAGEFQRRLVSDYRAGLVPASLLSHSMQIVADYAADIPGRDEALRQAFLHFFGSRIQEQLDHTGTRPEAASKRLIDHAVASSVAAMRQTAEQPAARPDLDAQRRPDVKNDVQPTFGEDRSIIDVFEAYAIASKLAPSTVKRWRPVFRHLTEFVGHTDVRKLSREALSSWRDDLAKTRSPVTVRDVYLASLKAVLGWLVDEGRLPVNVSVGVKVRVGKTQQLRTKSLTDAEAATILRAALLPYPGLGRPHAVEFH